MLEAIGTWLLRYRIKSIRNRLEYIQEHVKLYQKGTKKHLRAIGAIQELEQVLILLGIEVPEVDPALPIPYLSPEDAGTIKDKKDTLYTPQEIFDKVAPFLLKQGRRAERNGFLKYFGEDGTRSAIGALLDHADYSSELEFTSFGHFHHYTQCLVRKGYLPNDIYRYRNANKDHPNMVLLKELELIHDNLDIILWKERLLTLARNNGLCTDCIMED